MIPSFITWVGLISCSHRIIYCAFSFPFPFTVLRKAETGSCQWQNPEFWLDCCWIVNSGCVISSDMMEMERPGQMWRAAWVDLWRLVVIKSEGNQVCLSLSYQRPKAAVRVCACVCDRTYRNATPPPPLYHLLTKTTLFFIFNPYL